MPTKKVYKQEYWKCNTCGREFSEEYLAKRCEDSHNIKPIGVKALKNGYKLFAGKSYPAMVLVEFDDGTEIMYDADVIAHKIVEREDIK